jgi:putative addiction module component (TIGR02574 family)
MASKLLQEIQKLSLDERLELIDEIWETIGDDSEPQPFTSEQLSELDRRIADQRKNPQASIPWEKVVEELDRKYK